MVIEKGVPSQPSTDVGVTVYVKLAGALVSLNKV